MPQTPRLILRQWREEDLAPFAVMNADPRVMEHFPATLTRDQSDALAERARARLEEHGFGLWVVEVRESGEFAGFTGLVWQTFPAPFTRPSRSAGGCAPSAGAAGTPPRRPARRWTTASAPRA